MRFFLSILNAWFFFLLINIYSVLADNKTQLLQNMITAMHEKNYSQTVVYVDNLSNLYSANIIHAFINNHEYQKIETLNGPEKQIIQKDNKTIKTNIPNLIQEKNNTQLWNFDSDNPAKISKYYQIKEKGNERVAGRQTTLIKIKSIDELRYNYRMWIDKESNLLMKINTYNNKKLIDQFITTNLQIIDEATIKTMLPIITKTNEKNPTPKQKQGLNLPIGWMPDGFELIDHSIIQAPFSKDSAYTYIYSDGLAMFSIYLTKVDMQLEKNSNYYKHTYGATSTIEKLLKIQNNYYNVTLIGEIPIKVANNIISAIKS